MADFKNNVQKLVSKLDSVDENYDERNTFADFIRPLFEELGWNFQSDVKLERYDNSEANAFEIDGVTRFYLKEFPLSSSMESLKDEITSTVSYAYNKGVTWVIATNFKEMRVYNTESTGRTLASMQHYSFLASEYIKKFENLSDLTKKQFSLNVLDSDAEYFGKKPKRVSIDKQLLEDLLDYRNTLVDDIAKENLISEDDVEFAAQKILNRLIFIRSCGDRQIENRYLLSAMHEWEKNKDKKLSYYLQEIFSYFRGRYGSTLFEKHHCDELIISDKVLQQVIEGTYQSKKKAVRYNFAHIEHDSLGKMYENYLGTVQQKKDGAYYTPSYISKYICENTIIPYLSKSDVTNIPDLISEYSGNLEELEAKLNDIKILDPACGTGEFLIRAVDVLLQISTQIQAQKEASGQYTHTVKGKKSGSVSYQTFGKDVENKEIRRIIQNNIHGVDINEQAIEITQLNMFLKLAMSSQQLIDLSKNLLVGNSLINDSKIDPKALIWKKELPEKFDIVVGNPPYISKKNLKDSDPKFVEYLNNTKFDSTISGGNYDLSVIFVEKGFNLLTKNGKFGYIITNKFFLTNYGEGLRKFISDKQSIREIIDFGDQQVFKKNAATYTTIILLDKNTNKKIKYLKTKKLVRQKNQLEINYEIDDKNTRMFFIENSELTKEPWIFLNQLDKKINNRIKSFEKLSSDKITKRIFQGLNTGADPIFILKLIDNGEKTIKAFSKLLNKYVVLENDMIRPLLKGADIKKWDVTNYDEIIIFPYHIKHDKAFLIEEENLKAKYPKTYDYLLQTKSKLESREHGKWKGVSNWYAFGRKSNIEQFDQDKILIQVLANSATFALDKGVNVLFVGGGTAGGYGIALSTESIISSDCLIALLNSSFLDWKHHQGATRFGCGFYAYGQMYIENLPITSFKNKPEIVLELEKLVQNIISHKRKQSILEKRLTENKKNPDEQIKLPTNKIPHVEINDIIENMEAKIDSIIFKEYKVQKNEMKYIMNELSLHEKYKNKVIDYFNSS